MEQIQYDHDCGRVYSHSGKFSLMLPLMLPVVFVIALLLAFVYNFAIVYIPIIGYFSVLLTIGYAIGIGFTLSFSHYLFKVRNVWIARLLGVGFAVVALYLAWAAFVYVFYMKFFPKEEISFVNVLFRPDGIWRTACAISEKGWYSIKSLTPSGWVLWSLWGVEALIILGGVFIVADLMIRDAVFCEVCNKWTDSRQGVVCFDNEGDCNIIDQFMNHDFSFLQQAVPAKATAISYFRIDSSICETCKDLHTVSLLHVNKTYDDKGEESLNETVLVQNLIVSPDEYENLVQLKKEMIVPPPVYPVDEDTDPGDDDNLAAEQA